jgi:hypothetical protein
MCSPSGDQEGSSSIIVFELVRLIWPVPSEFITWMSECLMKAILPFEISVCWSPPLLPLPADDARSPLSRSSALCRWSATLHSASNQSSTTANPTVSTKVVRRVIVASARSLGRCAGPIWIRSGRRGLPRPDHAVLRLTLFLCWTLLSRRFKEPAFTSINLK